MSTSEVTMEQVVNETVEQTEEPKSISIDNAETVAAVQEMECEKKNENYESSDSEHEEEKEEETASTETSTEEKKKATKSTKFTKEAISNKLKQMAEEKKTSSSKQKNMASKVVQAENAASEEKEVEKEPTVSKTSKKRGASSTQESTTSTASTSKRQKVSANVKMASPIKERAAKKKAIATTKKMIKGTSATTSRGKTAAKKQTSELRKLELRSKAKASNGVPSKSAVTMKKKASNLSMVNALTKYRARLSEMDEKDFDCLDECWLSVYEPSLKKKKSFEEGEFPVKWTQVLQEVAEEKGVTIKGCLPHYHRAIQGTELKLYAVNPEIVDKGDNMVQKYADAGYQNVNCCRVYIGKKADGGSASKFAFSSKDKKVDEYWYAVKALCESSDSEA